MLNRLPLIRGPITLFFGLFFIVVSQHVAADTITLFDFGNTSSLGDMRVTNGTMFTVDDGDGTTTGDQNTSITFHGFLNSLPGINSGASVTIAGIILNNDALDLAGSITTTTSGGTFSLYNSVNSLLLTGNIGAGLISGSTSSSTGNFVTFGPTIFTGGSLLPDLDPNSGNLSITFTGVQTNGSTGLVVTGNSLNNFHADASGQIEADPGSGVAVPEPSGVALLWLASALLAGRRRRQP